MARDCRLPPVLGFGSWVGGDMDGNPNVGAATIAAALAAQRALVLARYRQDLSRLSVVLSQSTSRVSVDAAVLARIADYASCCPRAAARLKARNADMPYRQLLALMSARLQANLHDRAEGYADAEQFLADLGLIGASLAAHQGEHAGGFALRRLVRRVQAFGFHLATLDLRQDSGTHDAALAAMFGRCGLAVAHAARTRCAAGHWHAASHDAQPGQVVVDRRRGDESAATSTLAVFRTLAELRPPLRRARASAPTSSA